MDNPTKTKRLSQYNRFDGGEYLIISSMLS